MRIERLSLERFGHFSDVALDFSHPDAALWIIFGPNEAGKSTARTAISDLFFGFPAQTPFNFLHDYRDLRLGAAIRSRGGVRLECVRRKRRGPSLFDPQGGPLPEESLTPFLGGADRPLFETLFCLGHQDLIEGGKRILTSEGRLGALFFGASGGLRDLSILASELKAESEAIFTPRKRRDQPFHKSLDQFHEARAQLAQSALSADAWEENQTELESARADSFAIQQRLAELKIKLERTTRIKAILPLWRQLEQIRAEISLRGNLPDMPAEAPRHWRAAQGRAEQAREKTVAKSAEAEEAANKSRGLMVDEALRVHGKEIRRLYEEERSAVVKGRLEQDEIDRDLKGIQARMQRIAVELGGRLSATDLAVRRPAKGALDAVEELILTRASLDARVSGAVEAVQVRGEALDVLKARLAAAPSPSEAEGLILATDLLEQLDSNPEPALKEAESRRDRLEQELNRQMAGFTQWRGSAAALACAPLPTAETIDHFRDRFGASGERMQRLAELIAEWEGKRGEIDQALAALDSEGVLPTRKALETLRLRRDQLGQELIKAFAEGPALESPPEPAISLLSIRFFQAIQEADLMADRREREANRLARHAALREELGRAERALQQNRALLAQARMEDGEIQNGWLRAWRDAEIRPDPPIIMRDWMGRRDRILAMAESVDQARLEVEARRGELDRAWGILAGAMSAVGESEPERVDFSARRQTFSRRLTRLREQGGQLRELRGQIEKGAQELARETDRLEKLREEETRWLTTWKGLTPVLGLPAAASPSAGRIALERWREIDNKLTEQAGLIKRRESLNVREKAFVADVRKLAMHIQPDQADGEPLALTGDLHARLTISENNALRRKELGDEIRQAKQAARQATLNESQARGEMKKIQDQAGCREDAEVEGVLEQAVEKGRLSHRLAELEREILAQAGGWSLDQAIDSAAGMDPDVLEGEASAISSRYEELVEEGRSVGARLEQLRRTGEEMEGGRGADQARQRMADAGSDLEAHCEKWMLLKTASFLLNEGMERFRKASQGPVLQRAGTVFSHLTGGAFSGLEWRPGADDKPRLLGQRADQSICEVDGMSDGTRDQLYLALRIAAIESYGAETEPLPLIADDLFVNFDDRRATAGLKSLLSLGNTTQVLFFTHHSHLVELARDVGGDRVSVLALQPG